METIARRVRQVRLRRGLSQDDLAMKLRKAGVAWTRSTIAKLELGKRENISITELLALGFCLNCAPTHLLVPPEGGESYLITPNNTVTVTAARHFIRGFEELPGMDWRDFAVEAPDDEVTEYVSGRKRFVVSLSEGEDDG